MRFSVLACYLLKYQIKVKVLLLIHTSQVFFPIFHEFSFLAKEGFMLEKTVLDVLEIFDLHIYLTQFSSSPDILLGVILFYKFSPPAFLNSGYLNRRMEGP